MKMTRAEFPLGVGSCEAEPAQRARSSRWREKRPRQAPHVVRRAASTRARGQGRAHSLPRVGNRSGFGDGFVHRARVAPDPIGVSLPANVTVAIIAASRSEIDVHEACEQLRVSFTRRPEKRSYGSAATAPARTGPRVGVLRLERADMSGVSVEEGPRRRVPPGICDLRRSCGFLDLWAGACAAIRRSYAPALARASAVVQEPRSWWTQGRSPSARGDLPGVGVGRRCPSSMARRTALASAREARVARDQRIAYLAGRSS